MGNVELSPAPSVLRNRYPWFVLVVGILLTIAAALYVKSSVARSAAREFTSQGNEIQHKIIGRLEDHARLLQSGAALFNASERVTRRQWHVFTQSQKVEQQLPGIQGIGFSVPIPREELAQHVRKIRQEGFPEYRLKPAGDRELYTSIIYLEPFTGRNLRAFGYDMFSEPVRRAAMEQARDTGAAALSGKIVLVQETGAEVQAGTLMYVPVYHKGLPLETVAQRRAALQGWVYSPYRMNDLIKGILDSHHELKKQHIHLQLFDGVTPSPQSLLYGNYSEADKKLRHENLSTRQIQTNGRLWTLCLARTGGGFFSAAYLSIWLTAVGGAGITFLLFFLIQALLNTRAKAQRIAEKLMQERRESEETATLILNTIGEAVYGIDTNGCCTFCNPAGLRMLGYPPEVMRGKNMHDLIHHSHADGTAFDVTTCQIFKAFSEVIGCRVEGEVFWRADGTSFPVEYWSEPHYQDGRVIGAIVTFNDITERKKSQEELLQKDQAVMRSEKMASVGQLAAGVAHEINTPMGYISSNLSVLAEYLDRIVRFDRVRREVGDGELSPLTQEAIAKSRDFLKIEKILKDGPNLIKESLEGVERVTKIVQDLKSFSRVDVLEYETVALNSCLESALSIGYNELEKVATIRREYEPGPEVLCHPGQLNQVFLNLLINAGQAIVAPGEIVLRSWHDAAFVYASVGDTGKGIPLDIMARIFDRFFTTKDVGVGTGLGLSISNEIIKSHQGELLVESVVGVGTTFTVKLPRSGAGRRTGYSPGSPVAADRPAGVHHGEEAGQLI